MRKQGLLPVLVAGVLLAGTAQASLSPAALPTVPAPAATGSLMTPQPLALPSPVLGGPLPGPVQTLALARTCDDPWYEKSGIQFIACLFR